MSSPNPETPSSGRRVHMVSGNDAMSLMIDIYLSGMSSGMASILANFFEGVPESERDHFVHRQMVNLDNDPVFIETVRREISEIFTGQDSGPKNLLAAPLPGDSVEGP